MKLGHAAVNEGANNLRAMRDKLAESVRAACGALVVIVADTPTYVRDDGVLVTSISSLGP